MVPPLLSPVSLTILATYKCTAQCRECCFESSPYLTQRLSFEQILHRITEAVRSFPLLKLICFSGGECFLLGDDLDRAVAHATQLGMNTRCVSNGYWALTMERAKARILSLKQSGLTELNISTGDEHQSFVPFDRVVNAAIASANAGVTTLIVNEGSREAKFTKKEMMGHPRLKHFIETSASSRNLRLMENVWMSFHDDHAVTHEDSIYGVSGGCQNILANIVATPDGQLASCCGLTMEHIPEMKLGSGDNHDYAARYLSQLNDFMKIWIAVDGPKKILDFAISKNPSIKPARRAAHICEACVQIYKDALVQATLEEHYGEIIGDVMMRFHIGRVVTRVPEAITCQEEQINQICG